MHNVAGDAYKLKTYLEHKFGSVRVRVRARVRVRVGVELRVRVRFRVQG